MTASRIAPSLMVLSWAIDEIVSPPLEADDGAAGADAAGAAGAAGVDDVAGVDDAAVADDDDAVVVAGAGACVVGDGAGVRGSPRHPWVAVCSAVAPASAGDPRQPEVVAP